MSGSGDKKMSSNQKAEDVERMKAYRGGSFPSPIIPLSGVVLGLGLPYLIHGALGPSLATHGMEGLVTWLSSKVPLAMSGLFLTEFGCGAAARSTSNQASFSPAAAVASDIMPMNLIETNRIHQNHLESLAIFLPSVLSAAVVDARWAIACTAAWSISRVIYRLGYTYKPNPFWRICGVTSAMFQSFICVGVALSSKSSLTA